MKEKKILFKLIFFTNISISLYSNLFPLKSFSWSQESKLFLWICACIIIVFVKMVNICIFSQNFLPLLIISGKHFPVFRSFLHLWHTLASTNQYVAYTWSCLCCWPLTWHDEELLHAGDMNLTWVVNKTIFISFQKCGWPS